MPIMGGFEALKFINQSFKRRNLEKLINGKLEKS